jgi:hypothetical protein
MVNGGTTTGGFWSAHASIMYFSTVRAFQHRHDAERDLHGFTTDKDGERPSSDISGLKLDTPRITTSLHVY